MRISTIVTGTDDLAEVEQQIFEGAVARRDSWVSRYLLAPVEQAATRMLMPTVVTSEWLRIVAVLLTALAAFLFTRDWLWTGGILMLLSTPLDDIADRLASLRMQSRVATAAGGAICCPPAPRRRCSRFAYSLGFQFGWGCLTLAAATLAFVAALWLEVGEREIEGQIFLAERKGMIWLMLPFAVTGSWLGWTVRAVPLCRWHPSSGPSIRSRPACYIRVGEGVQHLISDSLTLYRAIAGRCPTTA